MAITKADCSRLVKHTPPAATSQKSGVDAQGRPIVSAALGSEPPVTIPGDLPILLKVDGFERFGIPANGASDDANLLIGLIVYRNGDFYFNGESLHSDEKAALTRACKRIVLPPS